MTKRYVLAALATLFLAACASTPSTPGPNSTHEVDGDYVSAVERQAYRASIDVRWVNPPTRKRENRDTEEQG